MNHPKEQTQEQHPLTKVKWGVMGMVTYRGCIVSKLIGGYSYLSKKYLTPQEVDKAIDDNCNSIDKSILK